MTKTEYLELVKEGEDDFYNIETVNRNLDKIDSMFGKLAWFWNCGNRETDTEKSVDAEGFRLFQGVRIVIRFQLGNTAADFTINVNGTGNIPVRYRGAPVPVDYIRAGHMIEFAYYENCWNVVGDLTQAQVDALAIRANTISNTASSAYTQANSAYSRANTAYNQANTASNTAANAYTQANNAYSRANSAYTQANNAYSRANSAYTQANNAYSRANSAYTQANNAYTQANNAYSAVNNLRTDISQFARSHNYSVAFGYGAIDYVASYSNCVAVGSNARFYENGAIAIGREASVYNVNGIAIGIEARSGDYGTTHTTAIAIGDTAVAHTNGGIAIGAWTNAVYYSSIAIGQSAVSAANDSVALGSSAYVASNNTIQLGSASYLSKLSSRVSLTVTSDERDKTDISDLEDGAVQFLNKIRTIRYVLNHRELYIDKDSMSEKDKEDRAKYGLCRYNKEEHAKGTKKGKRVRVGVSAQNTIEALKEIYGNSNYANIIDDNFFDLDPDGIPEHVENQLSANYEAFIPFLIKAVQEIDSRLTGLEKGN